MPFPSDAKGKRPDVGCGTSLSSFRVRLTRCCVCVAAPFPRRYEWGVKGARGGDPVWQRIRKAAKEDADAEPLLSSYMYMTILSHETLEQAISFVLANRLADSTLLPTQLMETFNSVLFADDEDGLFIRAAVGHCALRVTRETFACGGAAFPWPRRREKDA